MSIHPHLFSFVLDSTTRDNVDVRIIYDKMTRNPNLGPMLEIIDRNDVCTWFSEDTAHPEASKMKAALPGILDGTAIDADLVATAIFHKLSHQEAEYHAKLAEEAARLAEDLEARKQRIEELMEDGVSAEDAEAQVPPVQTQEDIDAANAPRPPMFLALKDFPLCLPHLEAMQRRGVPLHLVELITSKVPLERKAETPALVDVKAGAKGGAKAPAKPEPKKVDLKKADPKGGKGGVTEAAPVNLDPLAVALQKERLSLIESGIPSEVCHILVTAHDMPCDEVEGKDGQTKHVQSMSEDAFREQIYAHIFVTQAKRVQYGEWLSSTPIVNVPTLPFMGQNFELIPVEAKEKRKEEDKEKKEEELLAMSMKSPTQSKSAVKKGAVVEPARPVVQAPTETSSTSKMNREVPCPATVSAMPTSLDVLNGILRALPPSVCGVPVLLEVCVQQVHHNMHKLKIISPSATAAKKKDSQKDQPTVHQQGTPEMTPAIARDAVRLYVANAIQGLTHTTPENTLAPANNSPAGTATTLPLDDASMPFRDFARDFFVCKETAEDLTRSWMELAYGCVQQTWNAPARPLVPLRKPVERPDSAEDPKAQPPPAIPEDPLPTPTSLYFEVSNTANVSHHMAHLGLLDEVEVKTLEGGPEQGCWVRTRQQAERWNDMVQTFRGVLYFPEWALLSQEVEAALAPLPPPDEDDENAAAASGGAQTAAIPDDDEDDEDKVPPPPPPPIVITLDLYQLEMQRRRQAADLARKYLLVSQPCLQLLHVKMMKNVLDRCSEEHTSLHTSDGATILSTVIRSNTTSTRCTVEHGDVVFGFHTSHNYFPPPPADNAMRSVPNTVYAYATLRDLTSAVVLSRVENNSMVYELCVSAIDGTSVTVDSAGVTSLTSNVPLQRVVTYYNANTGLLQKEQTTELSRRVVAKGVVVCTMANGLLVNLLPNGSMSVMSPNKEGWLITRCDGKRIFKREDGTRKEFPSTLICKRADYSRGSSTTRHEDGGCINTLVDGTQVTLHCDGTRIERFVEGGVVRITGHGLPAVEYSEAVVRVQLSNGVSMRYTKEDATLAFASVKGATLVVYPTRTVVSVGTSCYAVDHLYGGLFTEDSAKTSFAVGSRGKCVVIPRDFAAPVPPPPRPPKERYGPETHTQFIHSPDEPTDARFAAAAPDGYGPSQMIELSQAKFPKHSTKGAAEESKIIHKALVPSLCLLPRVAEAIASTQKALEEFGGQFDIDTNKSYAFATKDNTAFEAMSRHDLEELRAEVQIRGAEGQCVCEVTPIGDEGTPYTVRAGLLYTFLFNLTPSRRSPAAVMPQVRAMLPEEALAETHVSSPSKASQSLENFIQEQSSSRYVTSRPNPSEKHNLFGYRHILKMTNALEVGHVESIVTSELLQSAVDRAVQRYRSTLALHEDNPPPTNDSTQARTNIRNSQPRRNPIGELKKNIMEATQQQGRRNFWDTVEGQRLRPAMEDKRKAFVAGRPQKVKPQVVDPAVAAAVPEEEEVPEPPMNLDNSTAQRIPQPPKSEPTSQEPTGTTQQPEQNLSQDSPEKGLGSTTGSSTWSPRRTGKRRQVVDQAPSTLDVRYQYRELPARRCIALASNHAFQQAREEQLQSIRDGKPPEDLIPSMARHDPMRMIASPSVVNFGVVVVGYCYEAECVIRNVGQISCRFTAILRNTSVPDLPKMLGVCYTKGPLAGGMFVPIKLTLQVIRHEASGPLSAELSIRTESVQIKIPITATTIEGNPSTLTTQLRQSNAKMIGQIVVPVPYAERERLVPGQFKDLERDSDGEENMK